MYSEEESESDSDLSMGSEEPDSRAASPQLDDIKGERWAVKKYGESADNAVSVRFVLLSLGILEEFVDVYNMFVSGPHFLHFLQSSLIFPLLLLC